MILPHRQISPEALQGLLEDLASREGTDYGEEEAPLAVKVDQLRRQLEQGEVFLSFDAGSASVTQIPKALLGALPDGGR